MHEESAVGLGRNVVNVKGNHSLHPNTTPKPKVWKVLKNVKKKWSHELKRAATATKMQVVKVRTEPKPFWHSRPKMYLLRYDVNVA